MKPLLYVFGANGQVLTLAMSYMMIILPGTVFMFPAYMLLAIFVAQGNSKISMIVQSTALTTNIILEPIFIYGLHLGVRGSAIASVIAFFYIFDFICLFYPD